MLKRLWLVLSLLWAVLLLAVEFSMEMQAGEPLFSKMSGGAAIIIFGPLFLARPVRRLTRYVIHGD